MSDDPLSLSMFWAGALMVFTPLVFAAIVLGVWWRQRSRSPTASPPAADTAPEETESAAP